MGSKLGASLALSGPEAAHGRQSLVAIEMALEDAATKSVGLRVEDDASDAARSQVAARELIGDPEVLAVVGPMNSWTAGAQAPLFAAAGLHQITHSASSPELAARKWPTFRRICPADDLQGAVLATVAAQLLKAARVGAIHDGTGFARPLARRFLEMARALGVVADLEVGIALALDEPADGDDRMLEALDPVADACPDAVLICGLEEPCRVAANALRRRGSKTIFLGTDAIKPTRVLVTDHDVEGPFLTCSCVDARRQAPEFDACFRARYGRHDSIYTVEAYDAARLLLEAIRRARPTDGDTRRRSVGDALAGIGEFMGTGGPVGFDNDGERADPRIGIYQHLDGRLRYLGSHEEVLTG